MILKRTRYAFPEWERVSKGVNDPFNDFAYYSNKYKMLLNNKQNIQVKASET